ncbi:MAG: peptide-methionine (S)-S-oxide reductase MsrA [Dehalococcoidia bacterium]|jgi:peptide-methionine (S)-S-oxide reductase
MVSKTETAIFGGGCFWCTEAVFSELKGVLKVMPGYTGGRSDNPTYQQVCGGNTGHVEAARIEYDPELISYTDLLEVFFYTHDPTTPNRQGNDVGEQYHSTIFYADDAQKELTEKYIEKLNESGEFRAPIVTTLRPLTKFYEAEDYHQRYYENNAAQPYCRAIIAPKMSKFRAKFKNALK